MSRLHNRSALRLAAAVATVAMLLFAAVGLNFASIFSSSVFSGLADRPGGAFNIVIACLSIPMLSMLCMYLFRGRVCVALGIFIIALNVSGRAADYFGVAAYTFDYDNFEQRVSLTTALLALLLLFVLLSHRQSTIHSSPARRFRLMFLVFACLTTVSQFLNHSPWSAAWLSIGAVWQYFGLLLIISHSVRSLADVRFLLKCIA